MLALISGAGDLPALLAQTQNPRPLVYALDGFLPNGLTPDHVFRLEHLGSVLTRLRGAGVTRVCLAGSIRRPAVDPALVDAATAPLVPQILSALQQGDDGALRVVMSIFESAGFDIVAASDLLVSLVPAPGVLTRAQPQPQHRLDAQLGARTVAAMGARDTGQACVVIGGQVIAREDAAGTDAMLARLARDRAPQGGPWDPVTSTVDLMGGILGSATDWLSGQASTPGHGGVLFKAPKPQQDMRADVPVIGPTTVDHVAAAGLEGIVLQGQVMVLQQDTVLARLNALNLFLWVRGGQD